MIKKERKGMGMIKKGEVCHRRRDREQKIFKRKEKYNRSKNWEVMQ